MASKSDRHSNGPTGYVETTPRGFRQDADNAMKGEIVRGLIEAMTNSDDVYGDRKGKILVSVSAKAKDGSFEVVVSDRATGILASEMPQKLLKAGERTSGHESGQLKRGNRGRGAKDLSAFGKVTFESVSNGEYARLVIERGGKYHGPVVAKVTDEERKRLGIPKANGMVTTVHCRSGVRRNQFEKLKRGLTNAVALRKMLQDPNREVLFDYAGEATAPIKFLPPSVASTVFDGTVAVEGYGNAKLQVFESHEAFNDSPSDISRLGGIVITSERACHEATLFSLEGNPYADKLFGYCDFPAIDDLVREFDARDDKNEPQEAANPVAIVRRDRDGLEHSHPAYIALRKAVEPILSDYVKLQAAKNAPGQKQSDAARRRNQNTANTLAKWMVEQDHELDIEKEPTAADESFRIIPPLKYVERGSEQVFSIRVGGLPDTEAVAARLEFDCDEGVEAKLSADLIELSAQEGETGLFHRGSFRIIAGDVDGVMYIQARLVRNGLDTDVTTEATVKIEEPREIPPAEPPATFMFDRKSYMVQAGKKKRLLLLAPRAVVDEFGVEIKLQSSEGTSVSIGGGNRARLEPVDEGWYEAEIVVEGKRLGAQAKITARIADHASPAETNVRVREDDIPSFQIIPKALKGNVRAAWLQSKDGVVVEVNATHTAAIRYFGPEEEGFPYQETIAARMLIAEVVADEAVRQQLKKEAEKLDQQLDAEAFYAKRLVLLADLLPRLHKDQLSDIDVKSINDGALDAEPRRLAAVS